MVSMPKPENYISVIKGLAMFYVLWPLRTNAGKLKTICYQFIWWAYFFNAFFTVVGIVNCIFHCEPSLMGFLASFMELTYISESFFNLVYTRLKRKQFQRLLFEIEDFNNFAKPSERALRHQYLKNLRVAFSLPSIFIVGAIIFALSPLATPNIVIPLNTLYYPIPMDKYWGRAFVYTLNVWSITQAHVAIVADLMGIAILWHATLKFELAGIAVGTVLEPRLRKAIAVHQNAISYADVLDDAFAPIVIKSTAAITIYLITCTFLLLRNVPLFEITQFFLITFLSFLRILLCSWSAEVMTQTAADVSWRMYNAPWFEAPPRIRQNIVILMQRCQKPTVVRISGLISALSLSFCNAVLYRTYSYFATLRVVLHL